MKLNSDSKIKVVNYLKNLLTGKILESNDFYNFDINKTAIKNLKSLKKKYNLTNDDFNYIKRFEPQLTTYILEKNNYSAKMVNRYFDKIITKEDKEYFKNAICSLLNEIENLSQKDHSYILSVRLHINILLSLVFEYACKYFLLENEYSINEPNIKFDSALKFKENDIKIEFKKNRTISLGVAWKTILDNNLIELSEDEKKIANYLLYLRNLVAHTPYLLSEKGNYADNCIALIKKLVNYDAIDYDYFNKIIKKIKK